MPKISETASFLLTLLNNIDELLVQSNDRKAAKDVMQALRIYGKNKGFTLPDEKIDNFFAIINDARCYTTTMLIKDIAEDIVTADVKGKKNKISS